MRFLIAGASGLIGNALHWYLRKQHHEVTLLVRPGSPAHPGQRTVEWDPVEGRFDPSCLERQDVVVCLTGHNLMDGRWTPQLKKVLFDSRVEPVSVLAKAMAEMDGPPKVFLSGSAVGYYGHAPWDQPKEESELWGGGFLADLCRRWEEAAEPALKDPSIRTVLMRNGFVLSMHGGALPQTVQAFQRGLGGVLGNGHQVVSWIAMPDLLDAIAFTVDNPKLKGPINFCAPEAIENRDFTKVLGKLLHKPAFLPIPAIAVRAKFGEVADELLLNGQRAIPAKLQAAGFRFRYSTFEAGLKAALAGE